MKRIGKTTTLVKVVGKKAKASKLFDQVIMGVVSETPNLRQIHDQLADMLGMRFPVPCYFNTARSLYSWLKDEKKILIILDDVYLVKT